jgi:sporulation protein YlmC with PRC-barrel domain
VRGLPVAHWRYRHIGIQTMAIVQTRSEAKPSGVSRGLPHGVASSSEVLGLPVVDCRSESIGVLADVMLDLRTGRVAYGVVLLHRAPEWSERTIAVPWNAIFFDADGARFRINARRDWVERAPSMQPDAMANLLDHECAVLIHSFFGAKPYWETQGAQQHS